jgi:hypothetical protein
MFFELSPERTSAEKFYISHNKHLKGYLQNRKENRKVKIFTLPSMGRVIQKTCLNIYAYSLYTAFHREPLGWNKELNTVGTF